QVVESMRHVGLETEIWMVYFLQQVQHLLPAMHTAPANFTFRRNFFTKLSRCIAGFSKSLGNHLAVACRIRCPSIYSGSWVNPYYAIRPHTKFFQLLPYPCGLSYNLHKLGAFIFASRPRLPPV